MASDWQKYIRDHQGDMKPTEVQERTSIEDKIATLKLWDQDDSTIAKNLGITVEEVKAITGKE